MTAWMKNAGPESDIVLSSRVRLARNLAQTPFPQCLKEQQGVDVVGRIAHAVETLKSGWQLQMHPLADVHPIDRQVLVEKHLASPALVQDPVQFEGVVIDPTETVSVMVNEEDHLRLQVFLPGLQLAEAWQVANRLDDDLESALDFSYDGHLGYLTACPTNLGTGLRASVMVHLPALVLTRQVPQLFTALAQIGVVVRGLYGEGSDVAGNIFQISNQVSLGFSEEEFIHNLTVVAEQIVGRERHARELLRQHHAVELADRVGRAWGILTHASIISSEEALRLLSDVKLGEDLGILRVPGQTSFSELTLMTRPGYLMKEAGRELTPGERDELRASVLRRNLLAENEGDQ
jgi:protein arginine kinase